MTAKHRTLSEFDAPPVRETVLGVGFTPLKQWQAPHFGLFWHEIRSEYPRFQLQPPLGSVDVNFSNYNIWNIPARCWFSNELDTAIIQVQYNRFIYNWRNYSDITKLPSYENRRAVFQSEWARFCSFLSSNQFDLPVVQHCEVTYLNHIEQGKGWETLADLPNIIPSLSGISSTSFLPVPTDIGLKVSYSLPDDRGQLDIFLQPVIRQEDGKELLQLQLIARGQPTSPEIDNILNWFDFARSYINNSFVDFTSNKLHNIWKKREQM